MQTRADALRARLPDSLREFLRRCFTVDTRSLAVFRMFVGLLIIGDLLSRSRNFHFYYTDDGVIPQALAESGTRVSLFFFTSDPILIAGLFVLHGLIAVVLMAGYKTRLALFLSFVFVISLDHHNPFVLSYADTLFRMLLFWALFLPLGERWSIDALQRDRTPRRAVTSLATAAIMIQMVFMYSVNAQNKFPSDLWQSGEAAIYVFGIDEMTFFLGDAMRSFPTLIQIGGRAWFYMLLASPLVILLYGRARYPLLVGLAGGHASFAITVRIGAFPYVAILGLMAFLQPRFWQDLEAIAVKLGVRDLFYTFYADGTRAGRFMATRLPGRLIKFRGRDIMARKSITVMVVIAMMGLFVLPSGAMLAEGPYVDENPLPDNNPVEDVASDWSVDQPVWSIFAGPGPRNVDRYYVFPARTSERDIFDVYNERPMTYDRPGQELQRQHDAYRKRFYMNTIRRSGQHGQTPGLLADHMCEVWEEEHGVELTHINMWEVTERITQETIDDPENRSRSKELIARHSCGPGPGQSLQPPENYDE